MRKQTFSVLALGLGLAACAETDRTGRELTALELAAVETCNRWLDKELRGTLGNVNLNEGVVMTEENSIDIAWDAQTRVGKGPVLCSTDRLGRKVIRAWVDGLEVSL